MNFARFALDEPDKLHKLFMRRNLVVRCELIFSHSRPLQMFIGKPGDPETNVYEKSLQALLSESRLIEYHPYPSPADIKRYERLVGGPNPRPFDEHLTLFFGQVPYDLPHPYVPWAVDLLASEYAAAWVKPTERMGGAKVWVNSRDQAALLKSLSEHLLFDVCGVWVARCKELALSLKDSAKKSTESRLARSAMTIVQATHVVHCDAAPHWSERLISMPLHLTPVVGVRPPPMNFPSPFVACGANSLFTPVVQLPTVAPPVARDGFGILNAIGVVKVQSVKVCRPGS